MRVRIASCRCRLVIVLLLLAPSFATAQEHVEDGRKLLDVVRATHLMLDFGIEALEPNQLESLGMLGAFSEGADDAPTEVADDEWSCHCAMLQLEEVARDMIAGKPVPDAIVKGLKEYSKAPVDFFSGVPIGDEEMARQAEEAVCQMYQQEAARLIAGKPSLDHRWEGFRSGDQLNWRIPEMSFDVAAMLKAYQTATPRSQHEMRILLGLRSKADEETVAFLLKVLKGDTPIERYDAAFAIGQLRSTSDKLIAALVESLSDPDPRVARAACRSLLALNATQAAPAMVDRLRSILGDKAIDELAIKVGFGFKEYNIVDGNIDFRYDLSTELMFAIGRFRHRDAAPLLWEIVEGKGQEVWEIEGHDGLAIEALAAIDPEKAAVLARRALTLENATVFVIGSAAKLIGEYGELDDAPNLLKHMAALDAAARQEEGGRVYTEFGMPRVAFAVRRLLFFAEPNDPRLPHLQKDFTAALGRLSGGPCGDFAVNALRELDRANGKAGQ